MSTHSSHKNKKKSKRLSYTGAAILPFSICRSTIAVLLTKERNAHWVRSQVLHADFGGGRHLRDRDAEATAAREFMEESLGAVTISPKLEPFNVEALAQWLRDGHYFRKIVTTDRAGRTYVTFLVEIPWQPLVKQWFADRQNDLYRPPSTKGQPAPTTAKMRPKLAFCEKETLNYFSLAYVWHMLLTKDDARRRLTVRHHTRMRFLTTLSCLRNIQYVEQRTALRQSAHGSLFHHAKKNRDGNHSHLRNQHSIRNPHRATTPHCQTTRKQHIRHGDWRQRLP